MTEGGESAALVALSTAIQVHRIGRINPQTGGWLIRDVTFALGFGERLGIVGPSGAGKTVLLRALALLDAITAGAILWRGTAVSGAGVPLYRSQVVYLHQRPALGDGRVDDNLREPFSLGVHRHKTFDRGRAVELLEALGRDAAFLHKPSRDLSGGEAQLVALIRAVLLDPAVLLLDEPTASLDPVTARAVEGLLGRWLADRADERAYIWVSHDRHQARRMTDRRIVLRSGRLDPEAGDA